MPILSINYLGNEAEIELKTPMTDMYEKEVVSGTIILKPYETKVYAVQL